MALFKLPFASSILPLSSLQVGISPLFASSFVSSSCFLSAAAKSLVLTADATSFVSFSISSSSSALDECVHAGKTFSSCLPSVAVTISSAAFAFFSFAIHLFATFWASAAPAKSLFLVFSPTSASAALTFSSISSRVGSSLRLDVRSSSFVCRDPHFSKFLFATASSSSVWTSTMSFSSKPLVIGLLASTAALKAPILASIFAASSNFLLAMAASNSALTLSSCCLSSS